MFNHIAEFNWGAGFSLPPAVGIILFGKYAVSANGNIYFERTRAAVSIFRFLLNIAGSIRLRRVQKPIG